MKLLTVIAVAAVGLGVLSGCSQSIAFDNSYYYDQSGNFQTEKAKDAYVALMEHHGYPVYDGIRDKMWVSDYGTGQFAKLGLGAVMWKNNEEDRYMLMDIYLMPNQMLPEHWHLDGETNPAKREGWLIRHGLSHVVGEVGESDLSPDIVIPKCHMNGTATTNRETTCGPGDWAQLNRPTARHWQFAGPEGAILTEVANVHTDSAVRHSDQAINDNFLGK